MANRMGGQKYTVVDFGQFLRETEGTGLTADMC